MSQINNLNDIDEQADSESPQLQSSSVLNFENNDDTTEEVYETDLTQDSVKTYLAEIGKNTLLKQNEEKQLAMELEISEELSTIFSDSLDDITITKLIDWFNSMKKTFLESKNSLDQFIGTIRELAIKIHEGDEFFKKAPIYTPIRRLDETKAARNPVLRWQKNEVIAAE